MGLTCSGMDEMDGEVLEIATCSSYLLSYSKTQPKNCISAYAKKNTNNGSAPYAREGNRGTHN